MSVWLNLLVDNMIINLSQYRKGETIFLSAESFTYCDLKFTFIWLIKKCQFFRYFIIEHFINPERHEINSEFEFRKNWRNNQDFSIGITKTQLAESSSDQIVIGSSRRNYCWHFSKRLWIEPEKHGRTFSAICSSTKVFFSPFSFLFRNYLTFYN